MSATLCQALSALDKLIWLYTIIMLVYAVLSWVPDLRGSWSRYVEMVVEPVLIPIRRVVPPAMGIDWSFMIVLLILWVIRAELIAPSIARCLFF
jgi:YggT family protein